MTPDEAEAALRAAGEADDDAIEVGPLALAFAARARREAGDPRYPAHLADLAAAVAAESVDSADAAAQVTALRRVLVERFAYEGDRESYDDLRNADLAHVIDRRRGLPVALSILWLHAGRAQGWKLRGINFPGHFLLRLDGGGERVVFDPFNGGQPLGPRDLRDLIKRLGGPAAELLPEHQAPLSDRGVLLRLQNNIKARRLQRDDGAAALFVLDGMLMLAPREPALWREAGLLHGQRDNLRAAQHCLARAAELAETPVARQRIAAELAAIRGRLN